MIIKFVCSEERLKELTEVVEHERNNVMKRCPFTDPGTGMLITANLIEDGFRVLDRDMLFEADTLPEFITGSMDMAVAAHGFYSEQHVTLVPEDINKRPVLIAPNS